MDWFPYNSGAIKNSYQSPDRYLYSSNGVRMDSFRCPFTLRMRDYRMLAGEKKNDNKSTGFSFEVTALHRQATPIWMLLAWILQKGTVAVQASARSTESTTWNAKYKNANEASSFSLWKANLWRKKIYDLSVWSIKKTQIVFSIVETADSIHSTIGPLGRLVLGTMITEGRTTIKKIK